MTPLLEILSLIFHILLCSLENKLDFQEHKYIVNMLKNLRKTAKHTSQRYVLFLTFCFVNQILLSSSVSTAVLFKLCFFY